MLTYLKVRDLAIVEELEIEPGSGLNVLTGETGAGKSLLIDSLEFLSGARGSTEMIRAGAEKMSAEAAFEAGEEMIVKREIAASGRGRVSINGSLFSVRELANAMDPILDIHGQSESHHRIAGQSYRELLDQFGGHAAMLDAVRTAYREWRDAASQLEELSSAQRDRALRLDLLKYQIDEISSAKLETGEEESLRSERSILAHAREMIEATAGAFAAIEEDENSALSQLARAVHVLQPLTRDIESAIQNELRDLAMERTTVRVAIEEASDSDTGFDSVDILVAPNRGEEPKAMQRIASGGELSRIQLAIAAALFKASPRSAGATLVFDEIDAGIGGRVAEVVGRKLQELAASNQVICVTHLPQIASFASTHFFVWKEDARGHTRARIRRLDDDEERVAEIARMLGGESVPASAVLHARELLDGARARP